MSVKTRYSFLETLRFPHHRPWRALAGLLLVLLLGLSARLEASAESSAEDADPGKPNLISVFIDNEYIQTYRGRLGQWVSPGGEPVSAIAARFGVTVEQIRELNDGSLSGGMLFVPMSMEVYDRYVSEGKGRREIEIDPRKMLWPVEEPRYSSRYGPRRGGMHTGLDLACPPNTVVVAADDGVVISSGWGGALGQSIQILHRGGLVSVYGHNTRVMLKAGEQVKRGQIIAFSGSTGRSTGPHVHFEVRFMSVAMNPEDFLQFGLYQPGVALREESPLAGDLEESARVDNPSSEARIGN